MTSHNQKVLFAMTNALEGRIFVNPNVSATQTTEDYVRQIAPLFDSSQIQAAASLYEDIGLETVDEKAVAIHGERRRLVFSSWIRLIVC